MSASAGKLEVPNTMLHPPRETAQCLSRPRLFGMLTEFHGPFTLVSAPAGYGKSVMVRDWLQTQSDLFAWLSLDERESDLRSFLSCLVASIRIPLPDALQSVGEALTAAELPTVDTLANLLLNDLELIEPPLVVVLDDYHLIEVESPVHDLLSLVLRYPPGDLRLFVLTRRDPPLPLASLRGRGALQDVRLEDLRFNRSEAEEFFRLIAPDRVSTESVHRAQQALEGWAAGFRLLAITLRNVGDVDGILCRLDGGLPVIQRYLVAEVFDLMAPKLREQLLRLSVLDRFCADLIANVLELDSPAEGRALISRMREENLFVIELDLQDEWFRFHHLLQQLMSETFESEADPEELMALQSRASAWFECHGHIREAIDYALRAKDMEAAADIFERYRASGLDSDQWGLATALLAKLPKEIVRKRPVLLLHLAWSDHEDYRLGEVGGILDALRDLLGEAAENSDLQTELRYLEAMEDLWAEHTEQALEGLLQLEDRVPRGHRLLTGEIALNLGLADQMAGNADRALERIRATQNSPGHAEDPVIRGRVDSAEVFIQLLCGDLGAAVEAADRMLVQAECAGQAYEVCWARYLRANAQLQRGELEAARKGFAAVVEKRFMLHRKAAIDACTGLTIAQELLGLGHQADVTRNLMELYANETGVEAHRQSVYSCQARLLALRDVQDRTLVWARQKANDIHLPLTLFWIGVPALNKPRILIRFGTDSDLGKARAQLEALDQHARKHHNTYLSVQLRVLYCLLLNREGKREQALTDLAEVVDEARRGGWLLPFMEPGTVMLDLLRELQTPAAAALVNRVLERLPALSETGAQTPVDSSDGTARAPRGDLMSLTNRELEILELLAQRLQNKEIAKGLMISTHTVNDHLKHIYQKLEVGNRRLAVRKAVDLGLITA